MPETEPTPWELMRVLRAIQEDVRSMRSEAMTKEAFREHQREERERHEQLGRELSDERTARVRELESAVTARNAAIADEKTARIKADADETTAREKAFAALEARLDRTTGWVKYGVTTAIGLLTTVLGWAISRGVI